MALPFVPVSVNSIFFSKVCFLFITVINALRSERSEIPPETPLIGLSVRAHGNIACVKNVAWDGLTPNSNDECFCTDTFALKMWTFQKSRPWCGQGLSGYMDGTDHPMTSAGRQSHKHAVFESASMEQWFHMKYAPCTRIWVWMVGNGFCMVLLCISAQRAQTASFL